MVINFKIEDDICTELVFTWAENFRLHKTEIFIPCSPENGTILKKKMSESQTGAGNLKNLNFLKFLKKFEILNFVNIKNDPRDMLNKFCFHLYAQNSLFIGENCNAFFLTSSPLPPYPLTLEFIELVPS